MNFPSKPWSDGQTAELIAGSTFAYDATKGAWVLQLTAVENAIIDNADSDFAHFTTKIANTDSDVAAVRADLDALGSGSLADINARIDSDYALNNAKHAVQEGLITGNANAISALRADKDSDVGDLAADISAIDTRLTTAEGEIDTLQTQMTAVLSDASDNAANIAALYLEADSDASQIEDLRATAASQAATITTILADLDSDGANLQALRTDLETEIASTNNDVTNLQNQITSNDTDISALQSDVATNTSDIATNASDIATNASDIATLQTNVTNNDSDIAANAAAISANASAISANATAIVDSGKIHKGSSAPSSPNANDIWFDTSTGSIYSWDATNSVWVQSI